MHAGKPWFDNVCVQGEGGLPWYAQLRVLFSFERRDFALVRWYDDSPKNDVLLRHGCRRLKWAMQSGPRQNRVPWYQVIPSVFLGERACA